MVACGPLLTSELRVRAARPLLAAGTADASVTVALVCAGAVDVRLPDRCERLSAGDGLMVAGPAEVAADPGVEARLLRVVVERARWEASLPDWGARAGRRAHARHPAARPARDLLKVLHLQGTGIDPRCRGKLANCAIDLLAAWLAAAGESAGATMPEGGVAAALLRQRIERFVLDRLDDPDLCVRSIAVALRISPRYLHKLYGGEGQGPMAWARARRLEACRDDLATRGARTIAEVAYAWGFRSPAHFSRAFKAQFGFPPRES